jgi:hypothetical protein
MLLADLDLLDAVVRSSTEHPSIHIELRGPDDEET